MPQSVIRVWRNGKPVSGARVVLSFSGGHTESSRTNNEGSATVDHASSGESTIFVDGKSCGTLQAPGTAEIALH